jgi:hypothetical protein
VNDETTNSVACELLRRRWNDLTRELQALKTLLKDAKVPSELGPYLSKIATEADEVWAQLVEIDRDLGRQLPALLDDLRSALAQAANRVQLLARDLAAPIVSPCAEDRLVTRVIHWAHASNPLTAAMPAACCDGDPGVWPFIDFVPLYYMPRLTRRGLLYLPLLFHEYGHIVYRCRRPEMDALVAELQQWISDQLEPRSRRHDALARSQRIQQRQVVATWYAWAQELFCDAVGLQMAGPCYVHAFSSYLSRLERGDYSLPREELVGSSHPVLWLRIRFLGSQARRLGLNVIADHCERDWETIANTLGVGEDYYGFFEAEWQTKVEAILSDMLTEADCRLCLQDEVKVQREPTPEESPIVFLNRAWEIFLSNKQDFADAERRLLSIATP